MGPRLLHYSDLEGVFDSPERVARLAGLIAELRDEETLVVGTGDNTAPGVLSLATEGRAALPFFEAVEPDADTFGNHDLPAYE
jgi:2',3'-cyclic-nucleotide 2'-phosphodiesterase (5'-nucleotidase family)